ncbi:MAG: hypothetical protein INR71_12325 [Terriglobus roseus]|nr:hypothetical protein [Terriglobus roseus]
MRTEMSSPFLVSLDNDWHTVYAILHGTQLSLYRLKRSLWRSRAPRQGRLLKTYSLQHAEIGVAVDFKKSDLIPRATFAKVLPKHAQYKLYETDPELFEPVREFVFRLRIEQEQLIFCANTHAEMLDWVEEICVGIDIAPPLDDRHEPRYRSLPRRTRRQRQIEAVAQIGNDISAREQMERQFIAQQEEILRSFYPSLATTTTNTSTHTSDVDSTPSSNDPADNNEFDREDVLGETPETTPSNTPPTTSPRHQSSTRSLRQEAAADVDADAEEACEYDPKTASTRPAMSDNALCRFRRRCAPILLASSPRASLVVFTNGARYTIDLRRCRLVPFITRPPRYEAHPSAVVPTTTAAAERPVLTRGITNSSTWSADVDEITEEDVNEAASLRTVRFDASNEELDRIDTVASVDTTSPQSVKGKGVSSRVRLAPAVVVRKVSANPLPRVYDEEGDAAMAIAAHAPLLV